MNNKNAGNNALKANGNNKPSVGTANVNNKAGNNKLGNNKVNNR